VHTTRALTPLVRFIFGLSSFFGRTRKALVWFRNGQFYSVFALGNLFFPPPFAPNSAFDAHVRAPFLRMPDMS